MDAYATDAPAGTATPPPVPQYGHFPAEKRRAIKEQHVLLFAIAFLLIALADVSGYLLHCLIDGAPIETQNLLDRAFPWFMFFVFNSAGALFFQSTQILMDCRILGDRFVIGFPHYWKEYSFNQLERVVFYENSDRAPQLVELKFRGYRRVLVANLADMQKFATSLRLALPENVTPQSRPHLGDRYLPRIGVLFGVMFLGLGLIKNLANTYVSGLLVILIVLALVALVVGFKRNPSIGYCTRWLLTKS